MKKILTILLFSLVASSAVMAQSRDFPNLRATLEDEVKVDIYPNPATDFVNVTISNTSLKNTKIILYNILGSHIEITPEKTSEGQYRLDLRSLKPGYYLLSVKDPTINFNRTYKFLKR